MIEKCEKYYNEYLNIQDSKDEIIKYKNEISMEKKINFKIIKNFGNTLLIYI